MLKIENRRQTCFRLSNMCLRKEKNSQFSLVRNKLNLEMFFDGRDVEKRFREHGSAPKAPCV